LTTLPGGKLYASSYSVAISGTSLDGRLYVVNSATGEATARGNQQADDALVSLAGSCDGTLFGVDDANQLVRVSTATGVATPVGIDQPFANRPERRLSARVETELAQDVRDVRPRRPFADAELSGDFLVRLAGANDAKNLELASSHPRGRIVSRSGAQASHQTACDGGIELELATMSCMDRRDHLVGLCVFEEISGRAGVERCVHAGLLTKRRECHHLDIAVASADFTGHGDPVRRRHLQIHEDYIG